MSEGIKPSAQIAAQLLHLHGITSVVASPGSRCAPMLEAFSNENAFKMTMIVDERCAAFYALGLAQNGKPVALVCTSGTAMLNYSPALAEAYYQGVPLIVISADRPVQWIDQDDSQTIRQYEALSHFVKASYDIPDLYITDNEMHWYASRTINEAINRAIQDKMGPVHINMQFNAPLTGEALISSSYKPEKINLISGQQMLSREQTLNLIEMLDGKKVLLVAGFLPPDNKLSKAVAAFSSLPNVALLSEKLSNLKTSWPTGIDKILRFADKNEASPDVVITIGGALVSRHIKEWMRKCNNIAHWSIGIDDRMADCFCHLKLKISVKPENVLKTLAHLMRKHAKHGSDYNHYWHKLWERAQENDPSETEDYCDLSALSWIYKKGITRDYNIQLSNGTSVRYGELLISDKQHAIYCNRGTSGIEGCTSTAIGAATAYKGPTLLVTGDMSFRHDLGALSLNVPDGFKILVVNNNGGDIFRFIATTASLPNRENRYCCVEQMKPEIKTIATTFGFSHFEATSMAELKMQWAKFINYRHKAIFELNTSHCPNAEKLRQYLKQQPLKI